MSRFWSPVVGTLSPYVPGEQPKLQNLVKLNTNEHPYGRSPKVLDAIRAACDDALKLYPDPSSDRLRQAIAATVGVQPGQVFVGNGSDEVLAHVFLALLKHDRPLRFPDITYSFYPVYCGLYGIQYETVPLTADFRIDVEDYLPARSGPAGAIIFPNPNAPTGRALTAAEVERIVAGNPDAVVVVDEAYVDFGGESVIALTSRYDNLRIAVAHDRRPAGAGLRGAAVVGEFRVRPAPVAGRRRPGRRAARTQHHRAPFPPAAHRPVPAHQRGHRGRMRAAAGRVGRDSAGLKRRRPGPSSRKTLVSLFACRPSSTGRENPVEYAFRRTPPVQKYAIIQ